MEGKTRCRKMRRPIPFGDRKPGYLITDALLCCSCRGGCRRLAQKLPEAIGKPGAVPDPVVDAVALQLKRGRRRTRIIGAHNLDGAAVAGTILFDDDNAVMGLLTGANARQANHQHVKSPLKKKRKQMCRVNKRAHMAR